MLALEKRLKICCVACAITDITANLANVSEIFIDVIFVVIVIYLQVFILINYNLCVLGQTGLIFFTVPANNFEQM